METYLPIILNKPNTNVCLIATLNQAACGFLFMKWTKFAYYLKLVRELMGEHLHVVHLLVVVEVPPHGGGQLGVEHGGWLAGHSVCLCFWSDDRGRTVPMFQLTGGGSIGLLILSDSPPAAGWTRFQHLDCVAAQNGEHNSV